MRDLELALKAAADPTRTRILKLLEAGRLCVCQVQAVLGLAPSTVSKHLTVLKLAGLVEDRRDGKWIEYALPEEPPHYAKAVLALLRGPLDRDPAIIADRKRLREVRAVSREGLCSLGPSRTPAPPRARSPRPRRSRPRHA
jgi:ArsR family transcriptional regulator